VHLILWIKDAYCEWQEEDMERALGAIRRGDMGVPKSTLIIVSAWNADFLESRLMT